MINIARRPNDVDDLDRQLISLLRDNARSTVAALAKKLRVARGTVQNRLAKLERDGTINGYTVKLKPDVEANQIRAVMTVAVEGNRTQSVLRTLRGEPGVVALHSTNGRWDFVAELSVENLQEFDRLIARISLCEGVSKSETNLLLTSYKV
jgi:DNA-binding Lrp family transcriptional regulator